MSDKKSKKTTFLYVEDNDHDVTHTDKSLSRLPVIIMSTSDEQRDIDKAYQLGANAYLSKPINWNLFEERMKVLNLFWGEHAEKPSPP